MDKLLSVADIESLGFARESGATWLKDKSRYVCCPYCNLFFLTRAELAPDRTISDTCSFCKTKVSFKVKK
jgi:hypothetical protein